MPELQPSWQLSLVTAGLLALLAVAGRVRGGRLRVPGAFGQEFALVMALLAVWQLVGGYVHTREAGALDRARHVWSFERAIHVVSEVDVQRAVLPHPWLVEALDRYYAYAHLNTMAFFLVLMWWLRREVYPSVRIAVVLTTLACLVVQVVPVAPPRLLPEYGFVDVALLRGESVYGPYGTGMANQLSAMPSVHVAWASIIAWYVWQHGPAQGRWAFVRRLGQAHLTVTVLAVVATANHWWLDGVVAAGFVALAVPAAQWWRGSRRPGEPRGPAHTAPAGSAGWRPWPTARASRPPSPSGSSSPRDPAPSAS